MQEGKRKPGRPSKKALRERNVLRIMVLLYDDQVQKMDGQLEKLGYSSRSDYIRKACQDYIQKQEKQISKKEREELNEKELPLS